jgi:hypothetical protein
MSEVFSAILRTDQINITVHGFDAAGVAGNIAATRTFATASDLRNEIVNARLWAGVHYRFSSEAGVQLGQKVARYDLRRFEDVGSTESPKSSDGEDGHDGGGHDGHDGD